MKKKSILLQNCLFLSELTKISIFFLRNQNFGRTRHYLKILTIYTHSTTKFLLFPDLKVPLASVFSNLGEIWGPVYLIVPPFTVKRKYNETQSFSNLRKITVILWVSAGCNLSFTPVPSLILIRNVFLTGISTLLSFYVLLYNVSFFRPLILM